MSRAALQHTVANARRISEISGWELYVFSSGGNLDRTVDLGSETLATGYTTRTGSTQIVQPLIADSEGRFTQDSGGHSFPAAYFENGVAYQLYVPADTIWPLTDWIPVDAISLATPPIVTILEYAPANDFDLNVLNQAIADINDITTGGFTFPNGQWDIEGIPDTITETDWVIKGEGLGTEIRQQGDHGEFFRWTGRWGEVRDLFLRVQGTAPSDEHALNPDGPDWRIRGIYGWDLSGAIHSGANTHSASRGHAWGINAKMADDTRNDWIRLTQATGIKINDIHINGGWDDATGNESAYVNFDGNSDGIYLHDFQFFCQPRNPDGSPAANGTSGKPYGFYIDGSVNPEAPTEISVNNIKAHMGCIDGTHTSAVYFRGDSDTDTNRVHEWRDIRMEHADGSMFDYDATGASGDGPTQNIFVTGCRLYYGNGGSTDPMATFQGEINNVTIMGNQITEKSGAVAMSHLFDMAINDWLIDKNIYGSGTITSDPLLANHIVKTTADIDRFYVGGAIGQQPAVGLINHFSYAARSTERIVLAKSGQEANPVTLFGACGSTGAVAGTDYICARTTDELLAQNWGNQPIASALYRVREVDLDRPGLTLYGELQVIVRTSNTAANRALTVGLYPITQSGGVMAKGTALDTVSFTASDLNVTNAAVRAGGGAFAVSAALDEDWGVVYSFTGGAPAGKVTIVAQLTIHHMI